MFQQKILIKDNDFSSLEKFLVDCDFRKILLVCGRSIERLQIGAFFSNLEKKSPIQIVKFSDFEPNPQYVSVVNGIDVYKKERCDAIFAVGGGSAIDVAKCIKLFLFMDESTDYLKQEILPNDVPLFAAPTTSGTGSESTKFAVVYKNGEKQSISDYSCIPSMVIFDPTVLSTLPEYQRKATMLDALCHAIESFWSINSTAESMDYSKAAIEKILKYKDAYLANDMEGNKEMLEASNIAGMAINITQTTAGHAMCYKLTSLFGIAHGHAAALCVRRLWPFMIMHIGKSDEPRGQKFFEYSMERLAEAFGCDNEFDASAKFDELFNELNLEIPKATDEEFEILKKSVNPVRLKNNPVIPDEEDIDLLYHRILEA